MGIKINRCGRIFASLPFFFIPFLGGNHLSLFYLTIDRFWIQASFVLLLLLSISLNFYSKRVIPSGFVNFLWFFLPYLIANLISLSYTWSKFSTLNELNIIVWVIGSIYLFLISDRKEDLLKALIFGASLSAICMIFQYKVLFPNLTEIFEHGKYGTVVKSKVVPFSSFLNEATLGGYFLFLIPLSIYFGVIQKKVLYVFTSSIVIFGLLFSLSRMGILLGLISILISFAAVIRERGAKGAAALLVMVLLVSLMFSFTLYEDGKRKDFSIQNRAFSKAKSVPEQITTLTYRTVTWKRGFNAFSDKPLFGYGAGTFEYAYRKYYEATLYTKYAHNIFIKIIVELGLVGLICIMIYLSGFVINLRRVVNKDKKYLFIALSAISGFVFAVFNVAFEAPSYMVTFFVLTSVFFNGNVQPVKSKTSLIFFLIVIALIGSFLFTTRSDISKKMNEDGAIFAENGLLQQAFNSHRESISSMPFNNEGYIGILYVLLNFDKIEKNTEQREKIRNLMVHYLPEIEGKTDRDSELFFLAGSIHALLGNAEKAESYLNKAIQHYPSSGYYMYETANFLFLNDNIPKAEALIKHMKTYVDRHTGSEMHGLYVYKMKDLESSIEYVKGNHETAFKLAKENLENANKDNSMAENILVREYVVKEQFMKYLSDRVMFYKSKVETSK